MTDDCREIRDLLDSYARGELMVETNHAVLRHLAACGDCAGELDRRQRALILLREGLDTPANVEALRRRVVAALDDEQRWWPRALRRWSIAAAAMAVVVAVWFALRGATVDAAAYHASVSNHVLCALTVPAKVAYDADRVARRLQPQFVALADRLASVPTPPRLVDAHDCSYDGRTYAHFVFRDSEGTVSLMAERRLRGALPAAHVSDALGAASPRVYELDEQGFHLAATTTRLHQIFVVADERTPADPTFVRTLLASATQFLTTIEP